MDKNKDGRAVEIMYEGRWVSIPFSEVEKGNHVRILESVDDQAYLAEGYVTKKYINNDGVWTLEISKTHPGHK